MNRNRVHEIPTQASYGPWFDYPDQENVFHVCIVHTVLEGAMPPTHHMTVTYDMFYVINFSSLLFKQRLISDHVRQILEYKHGKLQELYPLQNYIDNKGRVAYNPMRSLNFTMIVFFFTLIMINYN